MMADFILTAVVFVQLACLFLLRLSTRDTVQHDAEMKSLSARLYTQEEEMRVLKAQLADMPWPRTATGPWHVGPFYTTGPVTTRPFNGS